MREEGVGEGAQGRRYGKITDRSGCRSLVVQIVTMIKYMIHYYILIDLSVAPYHFSEARFVE